MNFLYVFYEWHATDYISLYILYIHIRTQSLSRILTETELKRKMKGIVLLQLTTVQSQSLRKPKQTPKRLCYF
jgi:hypothetical protein